MQAADSRGPGGAPERVVVAYVGGIGRSGSTLLCRALHQLPGTVHVGEICYLWNQSVRNDRLCSCGRPFRACTFWDAVGQRAFGGWDRAPVDRADDLRRRVERNRHLPRMVLDGSGPFQDELDEYAALMDRVLLAVRDVSGARVVVDNSKLPSTAYLRRRQPAVDLRLVHLVRSSYGVANSWARQLAREDFEGRSMQQFSTARASFEWTTYNAALEGLRLLGVPGRTVRYESFVQDPRHELARLAPLLDLELAPDALDFVGDGTIELAPDHSVWGNPMRVRSGPQPLRVDDAWRTTMPRRARATVSALTWPGLLRYGYLPAQARAGSAGRRSPASDATR